MQPDHRDIDAATTKIASLKGRVDELVHFCDTARDTLEVAFKKSHAFQVPRTDIGSDLVILINAEIGRIKDQYAYKNHGGQVRAEADAMFDVAARVIAQFDRICNILNRWKRSERATDEQIAQIRKDQIQHRMGDMMRVYKFFANEGTLSDEQVTMLSNIDLRKPLIPQLGFDPDTV